MNEGLWLWVPTRQIPIVLRPKVTDMMWEFVLVLLPRLVDMEEACFELELRDICGMTWVELRKYDSLPDMLEDLIKPYPLQFEGRRGEALLDELRKNLSSAFRGTEDLSLALRRTRLRALR